MENPFRVLREELNLTQHATSVRAHCSKHLIVRAEQGCYTDPPPVLMKFFLDQKYMDRDPTSIWLSDEYYEFQIHTRKSNRRFLGRVPDFQFNPLLPEGHPLKIWRTLSPNNFSLTAVAKKLCVNQSTLHRFENKASLQQSTPQALIDALEQCGYDPIEIHEFEVAYEKYRNALISPYTSTSEAV